MARARLATAGSGSPSGRQATKHRIEATKERAKAAQEIRRDLAKPVDLGGRYDVLAIRGEATSDHFVVQSGAGSDTETLGDFVGAEVVPVERGEVVEVLTLLVDGRRCLGGREALGDLDSARRWKRVSSALSIQGVLREDARESPIIDGDAHLRGHASA